MSNGTLCIQICEKEYMPPVPPFPISIGVLCLLLGPLSMGTVM